MEYNLGRKKKRVEKVTTRHWGFYCIFSCREEGIMMIKMVKKLSIVILFVGDLHADSFSAFVEIMSALECKVMVRKFF